MKLLVKGARLISAADGLDRTGDLLIEDGKIAAIGENLTVDESGEELNAAGLCLGTGLVDLFAHATEPQEENVEDILSLSAAAAAGGYTAVCVDTGAHTAEQIQYIRERGEYASCDILPAVKATLGRELLNYGELRLAGAAAVYDDEGIDNPLRMRDVMFRARKHNMLLLDRCRDRRLYREGIIREGQQALLLELPIIPASAESTVVARDIILAKESGSPLHIGHISTAGAVEVVRLAKAQGVPVTCSTEPHYFALESRELLGYNTLAKLDPPLGTPEDIAALRAGLADGTIDCIASGHTPVTAAGKYRSLVTAESGASSLETALSAALTYLYHNGAMPLADILHRMSAAPAALLGLDIGLRVGAVADLVLFDPDAEWVCEGKSFVSQGKNTPFEGKTLRGRVTYTLKSGRILAKDGGQ